MLTFTVEGQPVPKGRPRFANHAYTPKRTRAYETLVRAAALEALGVFGSPWELGGKMGVRLWFYRKGGKKDPGKELHRCDLDNLVKAVTDALNGVLYADDQQIDVIEAYREVDSEKPRVTVAVRHL